jgi:Co/Zn/Cd efflux system component
MTDIDSHTSSCCRPRRRSEVDTAQGKLIVAMVICVVFMVLEVIGGFLAGSVAIMTDAAHLLSDVTGFGISLLSIWLAKRGSTPTLSFGFKRAEILGALLSVLVIWFLTGVLVYEVSECRCRCRWVSWQRKDLFNTRM